jgi:hypothetical protein
MLTLDQPQAQISTNTEIHLTSDHGNWNPAPSTVQPTTFTISGTGGTIVSEYIVDRYNALLTVIGTSAGVGLILTDTLNNEAVSVTVMSVSELDSESTSDGDPVTEVAVSGDNAPPPPIDVPS